MPLKLPNISGAWETSTVSLGGVTYDFTFRLNGRDPDHSFLVMDIYKDFEPVIEGVAIVEGSQLLEHYRLDEFKHGELFCIKVYATEEPPTLGNIGPGKDYEIWYYSNSELLALVE